MGVGLSHSAWGLNSESRGKRRQETCCFGLLYYSLEYRFSLVLPRKINFYDTSLPSHAVLFIAQTALIHPGFRYRFLSVLVQKKKKGLLKSSQPASSREERPVCSRTSLQFQCWPDLDFPVSLSYSKCRIRPNAWEGPPYASQFGTSSIAYYNSVYWDGS